MPIASILQKKKKNCKEEKFLHQIQDVYLGLNSAPLEMHKYNILAYYIILIDNHINKKYHSRNIQYNTTQYNA